MESSNDRTLFVGNLSERVTEETIQELFLQAGPLISVRIPLMNGRRRNFGFVEYKHEISVPYAARLFHRTTLYGRLLNLQVKKNDSSAIPDDLQNTSVKHRLGPPLLEDYGSYMERVRHNIQRQNIDDDRHHHNNSMPRRRIPSHLVPKERKRKRDDDRDKNNIPDDLNYTGLLNRGNVGGKKKKPSGTNEEDLRSKIKKKKKKKKHNFSSNDELNSDVRGGKNVVGGEIESAGREGKGAPQSCIQNAVNNLKKQFGRKIRGRPILNSHKNPKHIRFDSNQNV